VMSARQLRERLAAGEVTVATPPVSEGFAILVPVAPTEHLPLLAAILPEAKISRRRRAIAGAPVFAASAAPGASAPQTDSEPVVAALQRCGLAVDRLVLIAESALGPRLHDGELTIGAGHGLAELGDEPRAIAAIGIIVARTAEERAHVLGVFAVSP